MLCYHDCSWNTYELCIIIILNEYHYYQSSCNMNQIIIWCVIMKYKHLSNKNKKNTKNIDKETHPALKITHKTTFIVKQWWSRKQESFLAYLIPNDRFLARKCVAFRKPGCMWWKELDNISVLIHLLWLRNRWDFLSHTDRFFNVLLCL